MTPQDELKPSGEVGPNIDTHIDPSNNSEGPEGSTEPSKELQQQSPEDKLKNIEDEVNEFAKTTQNVNLITKFIKSKLETVSDELTRQMVTDWTTNLTTADNVAVRLSAKQLLNFISNNKSMVNPVNPSPVVATTPLSSLEEERIKLIVKCLVERELRKTSLMEEDLSSVLTKERVFQKPLEETPPEQQRSQRANVSNFTAQRQLLLTAAGVALKFETDVVRQLGLIDPDSMNQESQRKYLTAMEDFKAKLQAAVVDAVKAVKDLPKNST